MRNWRKTIEDHKLEFAALMVLVSLILLGLLTQNIQLVEIIIVLLIILVSSMFMGDDESPPIV